MINKKIKTGMIKMTQIVKSLATKLGDLSSIPGTRSLFSDIHTP